MHHISPVIVRPDQWLGAHCDMIADVAGDTVIVQLSYAAARHPAFQSVKQAGRRLVWSSGNAIDAASAAAGRALFRRSLDERSRILIEPEDVVGYEGHERLRHAV